MAAAVLFGFVLVDRFRVWANVAEENITAVIKISIVRFKIFLLSFRQGLVK